VVPVVPVRPNPALAGRHVLLIAIERDPDAESGPAYVRAVADHLAVSAPSVTVISAVARRPSWRDAVTRRRSRTMEPAPRGPGRAAVAEVSYTLATSHTAVTRAAYEATHLARAATSRMPHQPDLVIAATPGLGAVVAAARVARKHGAPLLVLVQDLMATAGGLSRFTAALEGHALANADHVAIMSERFRDAVHGYGLAPERVHLLPTWTPLDRSPLTRREARTALGWATRGYVVLLVTPMGRKQDVGNVIEAARLLEDRADVRFMLVGSGTQKKLLQEQARHLPAVRFKDPVDPADLPTALAAADVLLVNERPGETTAHPALVGLLGAGRPVVAAVPDGGPTASELDRTGGAGLVVPPGDPAALAAAIRLLMDEPNRRLAMADLALSHALASLGQATSMDALDAIVTKVLSGPEHVASQCDAPSRH
jgi:colanic acid biosynthesis glycosyl transferase WcaI